jgi:catechol 2,3-dioxygenase-like lactoylglutathione lyase family enzyme
MVPDIDAALKFYRDLLGFRITDFMGPPVSLYFMHVNTRPSLPTWMSVGGSPVGSA